MTSYPDFGLTPEERHQATFGHYYEAPGGSDGEEIWCYTDQLTYGPGETLHLQVSCSAPSFDLEIWRDGASPRSLLQKSGLTGRQAPTPEDCAVTGCGWPSGFDLKLPVDWPSGAYRITVTAAGGAATYDHLFVLRPRSPGGGDRLLFVTASATWTAYNDWGGSNAYEGITGPNGDQFSPLLSIERPWARGFIQLPAEAPRVTLQAPPMIAAQPRYPHMEWAFATGHSKKYASAGWASYDRHFVDWAEGEGYEVDVITQHDLHFRPELLEGYRCLVMVGHDEYWSWAMRDAVDRFVEQGGRVARFAGNFMWQIRMEEGGRRQVCYKYRARAEDPLYGGPQQRFTSTSWEAPEVGRHGAATFGLNAARGIYAGWGACAARGAKGFPIYRPAHWAFAGTGLSYGDLLGAEAQIFGYEVDGLDYEIRGGLPFPSEPEAVPDGLEILALGLASLGEEGDWLDPEASWLKHDDSAFVAEVLLGASGPEAIDQVKRGCGMIVTFRRGKGEVFHAGSCEWVAGLLRRDPMVMQVTRNVLDRFLGGSD